MSVDEVIQYKGRAARRSGSEQRRQTILEAALRIIVKDGVRAVRHRAVAREANVSLSATTYYFKDISDLIHDTFTLFVERALGEVIEPFRQLAFSLLADLAPQAKGSVEQREQLLNQLSSITSEYIINEIKTERDHLVAEQAFFSAAIIEPKLVDLANLYIAKQREGLIAACQQLGSLEPQFDGEIILSVIHRLERRALSEGDFNEVEIHNLMRHTLDLIVPSAP